MNNTDEQPASNFLQKLARILTGDTNINVTNTDLNGGLAGAAGKTVYIDLKRIQTEALTDLEAVTIMKALNLHETAHIEYTEWEAQEIADGDHEILQLAKNQDVNPQHIKDALNILEDARIENLRAAQYPNADKYLLYNVMRYILKGYLQTRNTLAPSEALNTLKLRQELKSAFILTYGRKFINPKINQDIQQKIIDGQHDTKHNTERTKTLIDTYLTANTEDERIQTGIDFARHIYGSNKTKDRTPNNPHKASQYSQPYGNKANTHNQNEDDEQDETPQDKKQRRQKQAEARELTQQIREAIQQQKTAKPKASNNTSTDTKSILDQLIKNQSRILRTAADNVKTDAQKILQTLTTKTAPTLNQTAIEATTYHPTSTDKIISQRIRQRMLRLRNGLVSRYQQHKRSGRLNIRAVMQARNQRTDVFKKYEQSQLGRSRMAVTLIIDGSGSMSQCDGTGYTRHEIALSSAWAIEAALSQSGDHTQILQFQNGTYNVLKNFTNRSTDWTTYIPNGNTKPAESIKHAIKQHQAITHTNNIQTHLIVLLTDGEIQDPEETEHALQTALKKAYTTLFLRITDDLNETITHTASIKKNISTAKQLEPIIEATIQQIQTNIRKHTRGA